MLSSNLLYPSLFDVKLTNCSLNIFHKIYSLYLTHLAPLSFYGIFVQLLLRLYSTVFNLFNDILEYKVIFLLFFFLIICFLMFPSNMCLFRTCNYKTCAS
ncbi:hypothetical protein RND81_11G072500 [Saponaria officinalis]|uniref:Uncharacterized protein n=1 Tax=Saponaria officinalis TaxID=3572 RepID=A0AAW1HJ89_SAPOF